MNALRKPSDSHSHFLFEVIVRDSHASAMQVGCVATLLTHDCGSTDLSVGRCFRHLVHDDSRVSQLALRYGEQAELTRDMIAALDAAYEAVRAGRRELGRALGADARSGARSACIQIWRRVAGLALTALDRLHPPVQARLKDHYVEDSRVLQEFLREAVQSRGERVDAHGIFRPPSLRQRRRSTV